MWVQLTDDKSVHLCKSVFDLIAFLFTLWFKNIKCFCHYQVLLNLANQYANNEMYPEALNSYQVIVKNKVFSNAGEQTLQLETHSECVYIMAALMSVKIQPTIAVSTCDPPAFRTQTVLKEWSHWSLAESHLKLPIKLNLVGIFQSFHVFKTNFTPESNSLKAVV